MKKKDLIGRLEFEPVRPAFHDEARHFTTWLEQHLEVRGERLGIGLTLVQREKAVGEFNVDLLCEDGNGARRLHKGGIGHGYEARWG